MQTILVSILIPTKNSGSTLEACLASIAGQTHSSIEVLVIDGNSIDATRRIAARYDASLLSFDPHLPRGTFDAPHRRNFGAQHSTGDFLYFVDADMELGPTVVADAVSLCNQGYDAVIIPEDSFGDGIWARAKTLERRCYLGDDNVEAPRFLSRKAWAAVGGLDEALRGGGDDWDLYQKLKERNFRVGRSRSVVRHNEGRLTLRHLARKRFMYGQDALRYVAKRPRRGLASYFPVRKGYIDHWRLLAAHPFVTSCVVMMRAVEYSAGAAGLVYAGLHRWTER